MLAHRGFSRVTHNPPMSNGFINALSPPSQVSRLTSRSWTRHPTTAGADGDEGAFTHLPGWAVGLTGGTRACRQTGGNAKR